MAKAGSDMSFHSSHSNLLVLVGGHTAARRVGSAVNCYPPDQTRIKQIRQPRTTPYKECWCATDSEIPQSHGPAAARFRVGDLNR